MTKLDWKPISEKAIMSSRLPNESRLMVVSSGLGLGAKYWIGRPDFIDSKEFGLSINSILIQRFKFPSGRTQTFFAWLEPPVIEIVEGEKTLL